MDLYKGVTLVCQHIPGGGAATYGQIALLCDKPRNAKQVGYALNRELAGERVPAHRVVNTKGVLSGVAALESHDVQKLLLEQGGVAIAMTPDGWGMELKRSGWDYTLEDVLWFRAEFEKRGIQDRIAERPEITGKRS